jgi:hypothetical protein
MNYDEKLIAIIKDPNRESRPFGTPNGPAVGFVGVSDWDHRDAVGLVEAGSLDPSSANSDDNSANCHVATQCTELGEALKRLATYPYRPDEKPN